MSSPEIVSLDETSSRMGAPTNGLRGWLRLARAALPLRRALELAVRAGDPALFATADPEAWRAAGADDAAIAALSDSRLEARLRDELDSARDAGWTLLDPGAAEYPSLLSHLGVPPPLLSVRGRLDMLALPAVAIVGARAATPYGLRIARELSSGLAERGLAIVSGLARGIDAAAHESALDAGGVTLAVMGTGRERIYPPEHAALAERIALSGALLTEFPPDAPPRREHFPQRNRLIAGLSYAVVVVEADFRSGSLSTARWAQEEGRSVLAVPGRAGDPGSLGPLSLLRDGAALAATVEDVLEELPAEIRAGLASPRSRESDAAGVEGPPSSGPQLDADQRLVLSALQRDDARHIDDLIGTLALPPQRVLSALFALQLLGLALAEPGARFRRGS